MKTNVIDRIEFRGNSEVLVYQGETNAIRQPETFQFCALGLQLYTPDPLPECHLLDLQFALPTDDGMDEEETIHCTGMVAQCSAPSNGTGMYRVWIKFLDLPEEKVQRIRQFTTSRNFTCPWCANL